jgi:organic hydroperoxide reductase OsmC/OhrA
MAEVRARVFEYEVRTDADWTAHSDRGGSGIPREDAWTPEHLLLAALARCTQTSLEYHAKRADVTLTSKAEAHGTVTRREGDGRYALVAVSVAFDVSLAEPRPARDAVRELLAKAERDCFVGASLTAKPTYSWNVDGEEL